MTTKMAKYNIRVNGLPGAIVGKTHLKKVEGEIIGLPNPQGFTLFMYEQPGGNFAISEYESGALVGTGLTKEDAMEGAINILNNHKEDGAALKAAFILSYGVANPSPIDQRR